LLHQAISLLCQFVRFESWFSQAQVFDLRMPWCVRHFLVHVRHVVFAHHLFNAERATERQLARND
jgi:hypothetical protein